MLVVSNSSPIINLSAVNKIEILKIFFQEILIPKSVYFELISFGDDKPGAKEAKEFSWIQRVDVKNINLSNTLNKRLGIGESDAIVLAIEFNADLILLDDKKARKLARDLGLSPLGTIGILYEAKKRGLIESLKNELDDLITKNGFFIDEELYKKILQEVGEF